jgi:hypothetical protein
MLQMWQPDVLADEARCIALVRIDRDLFDRQWWEMGELSKPRTAIILPPFE